MNKDEVLDILGRKCKLCSSKTKLEIHHILPYWLWRYLGETDNGIFSTKFLSNYEVLCRKCHMKRHDFIKENLYDGFRRHYSFEIKWKRKIGSNTINGIYELCLDESGWCSFYLQRLVQDIMCFSHIDPTKRRFII